MNRKPVVAVVGRPNVGKSTFFNRVAGEKISIVENRPGVTRDRIISDAEWNGIPFTIIDTGGLELKSDDTMFRHIRKQAEIAVDTADVIIFFTDVKDGLVPADADVAAFLRRSKKPVVLAVNKLDQYKPELLYEFYELGLGEPFGISSELGQGVADLLDEVVSNFGEFDWEGEDEEVLKIAVVGRPNAGKSSIVNRILGFERTIVSDIAGTTRDAIDTPFTYNGKKYRLIDTAGIRRKRSVDDDVEYYSVLRALAAIRRADVCLITLDATREVSEQDVRIAGYVHRQGKPSVVIMNKWDLIEKDTYTVNRFNELLDVQLAFMSYYQPLYVSALTGKRMEKVIDMVDKVYERSSFRPTTGVLNEVIQDAVRMNEPPSANGKRLKILYATVASVNPPTFIIFVNDESLMHFSYKRYLENHLRKVFHYEGTPIRVLIRNRDEKGEIIR